MYTTNDIKRVFFGLTIYFLLCYPIGAQKPTQILKGTITDRETSAPLSGAYIVILNSSPLNGTVTDINGKFRIATEIGRLSVKVSFLGYEDIVISDILVASGKEVDLNIELREKLISSQEVVVRAGKESRTAINQMASISAQTIRSDDALRFAGGFYDPSRIVNSFAGVVAANSDESNDIVIRGNSSRGLLWRLEGIEIPNPNHFSDGQGGSGGAYSAITSNVISNFDFFTGAFPAEYGNAISGIMDLNLRKGNPDHREYAFQTGMIGAEISAEGPLKKESGASFLIDSRYVNFGYLSRLKVIDLGSTNFAPRSQDVVFNINLKGEKSGNINIFGFYGSSELGKVAVHDIKSWSTDDDRWEEMQGQGSAVLGIKHLKTLQGGMGYIRSVVAYTDFYDSYSEGYVDSSFIRTNSNHHNYRYPSLRFSFMMNNRLSSRDVLRIGVDINFLGAIMEDIRLNSTGAYDSFVSPNASEALCQYYAELKTRITENIEINSGLHLMSFSINGGLILEPRLGFRWQFAPGKYFSSGMGLHSKSESIPVYYSLIKNSSGLAETLNESLGFSKSFHFVSGLDIAITANLRLKFEGYSQTLFDVPIINQVNSTYSAINTSEELPLSPLTNKGVGYNRGLELTLERSFLNNFYFLYTGSLFRSKFKPGNGNWYNTYYNTSFVTNFLAGKDFYLGRNRKNSIGINTKFMIRGGYRYTPFDLAKSIKSKKIIYNTSLTYGERLPDFIRIDAGINFRRNKPGFSWIIMLDVQNLTNRKNVFRKRFSYTNGSVTTKYDYSIGIVPVVNLRVEF